MSTSRSLLGAILLGRDFLKTPRSRRSRKENVCGDRIFALEPLEALTIRVVTSTTRASYKSS